MGSARGQCVFLACVTAAFAPAVAEASPNGIVISEVRTSSPQFVEMVNAGSATVSLAGHCLKVNTSGMTAHCFTGSLAPGQHYLAGETGGAFPVTPDGLPMGIGAIAMAGSLAIEAPGGVRIDQVGYGGGDFLEGTPAPAPAAGQSIVRRIAGAQDTDNNAADFVIDATPGPQNSSVFSDFDGDGRVTDNCPTFANPSQLDTDRDARGDACDADDDNDGRSDLADNCVVVANPDQGDLDLDRVGSACDPDDDNDGLRDIEDRCPLSGNPTIDGCRGGPSRPTDGDDLLIGTLAVDILRALRGNDRIFGLDAADLLDGGPGADRIDGGDGGDRLIGAAGDDRLLGREGRDRLDGGAGRDRLDGGDGRDRLTAGGGNDTVAAADGVRDTVDCGSGRDTVRADRIDRLRRCEQVKRRR